MRRLDPALAKVFDHCQTGPVPPGWGWFRSRGCLHHRPTPMSPLHDPLQQSLGRWQTARSWARLILAAEALWAVEVRAIRKLASEELLCDIQEVPPRLRRRVNRWLRHFHAATRLPV